MLSEADLVIGAVLVHGAKAPHVVKREQLKLMKEHAVLVDVSIDQGGCFETSRPTTHTDPTYEVDGVTHYCVANMPGAVPITSTFALTNATMPYVVKLATEGVERALLADPGFLAGLNVAGGKVTYEPVARDQGREYTDPREALSRGRRLTELGGERRERAVERRRDGDQQQARQRHAVTVRRRARPVRTVTRSAPLEPKTAWWRSMSTITSDVSSQPDDHPVAVIAVHTARPRGSSSDCAPPTAAPVISPVSITSAASVPEPVTTAETAAPAAIAPAVAAIQRRLPRSASHCPAPMIAPAISPPAAAFSGELAPPTICIVT